MPAAAAKPKCRGTMLQLAKRPSPKKRKKKTKKSASWQEERGAPQLGCEARRKEDEDARWHLDQGAQEEVAILARARMAKAAMT